MEVTDESGEDHPCENLDPLSNTGLLMIPGNLLQPGRYQFQVCLESLSRPVLQRVACSSGVVVKLHPDQDDPEYPTVHLEAPQAINVHEPLRIIGQ